MNACCVSHLFIHLLIVSCSLSPFFIIVPFLLLNKDQSTRSERSSISSDTRTKRTRRAGTRTRARRGVQAVTVTTTSMIAELQKKKEKSDKQATFEEELSSMDSVLKKAEQKLKEGGTLTVLFLKALIKSKGSDPPIGRKKAPFEATWNKVKDDADWKRKVFFNEREKKELQLLEEDNSEDEE